MADHHHRVHIHIYTKALTGTERGGAWYDTDDDDEEEEVGSCIHSRNAINPNGRVNQLYVVIPSTSFDFF